jgi:poly(ADP-ribose) glycohydrolase ARH3
MAIGIAESLCECEKTDVPHLGETFRKNYAREPWRGYGAGPPRVFRLIEEGYSFTQAAQMLFNGTGSYGNGAAMRITPLGLTFFSSQKLYSQADKSAVPTHAHPLGKDAAAVLAKAISQAVTLRSQNEFSVKDYCKILKGFATTSELKEKISVMENLLLSGASISEASDKLGTDVTAINSVPFAIFSFIKNITSFAECLLEAVLAGGDRDTIGAMSCALSGAYLGVESLPSEWLKKLEHKEYIEELSGKLFQLAQKIS